MNKPCTNFESKRKKSGCLFQNISYIENADNFAPFFARKAHYILNDTEKNISKLRRNLFTKQGGRE